MPAYRTAMDEKQLWQISLLLAHADKLPAEVTSVLQQPYKAD
jgi:hypothetical protein